MTGTDEFGHELDAQGYERAAGPRAPQPVAQPMPGQMPRRPMPGQQVPGPGIGQMPGQGVGVGPLPGQQIPGHAPAGAPVGGRVPQDAPWPGNPGASGAGYPESSFGGPQRPQPGIPSAAPGAPIPGVAQVTVPASMPTGHDAPTTEFPMYDAGSVEDYEVPPANVPLQGRPTLEVPVQRPTAQQQAGVSAGPIPAQATAPGTAQPHPVQAAPSVQADPAQAAPQPVPVAHAAAPVAPQPNPLQAPGRSGPIPQQANAVPPQMGAIPPQAMAAQAPQYPQQVSQDPVEASGEYPGQEFDPLSGSASWSSAPPRAGGPHQQSAPQARPAQAQRPAVPAQPMPGPAPLPERGAARSGVRSGGGIAAAGAVAAGRAAVRQQAADAAAGTESDPLGSSGQRPIPAQPQPPVDANVQQQQQHIAQQPVADTQQPIQQPVPQQPAPSLFEPASREAYQDPQGESGQHGVPQAAAPVEAGGAPETMAPPRRRASAQPPQPGPAAASTPDDLSSANLRSVAPIVPAPRRVPEDSAPDLPTMPMPPSPAPAQAAPAQPVAQAAAPTPAPVAPPQQPQPAQFDENAPEADELVVPWQSVAQPAAEGFGAPSPRGTRRRAESSLDETVPEPVAAPQPVLLDPEPGDEEDFGGRSGAFEAEYAEPEQQQAEEQNPQQGTDTGAEPGPGGEDPLSGSGAHARPHTAPESAPEQVQPPQPQAQQPQQPEVQAEVLEPQQPPQPQPEVQVEPQVPEQAVPVPEQVAQEPVQQEPQQQVEQQAETGAPVAEAATRPQPAKAEDPARTAAPAKPARQKAPAQATAQPQQQPRPQQADKPAAATPADADRAPGYGEDALEAVYRVIHERRDIRNDFLPDELPTDVLTRILEAAHTAPSVGFSQPWDFLVLRDEERRRAVHDLAVRQRREYAASLPKARAKAFAALKIEAILETPVNIVVTCDPTRGGRHTLGRYTQPMMAPFSTCLAVENLWLAARAEGLGVGWVSFFDERELAEALGLPEHLQIVAYLCVGYVKRFPSEPELAGAGWARRRPLSWAVHEEDYGRRAMPGGAPVSLLDATVDAVRGLDEDAAAAARERQGRMTKPPGSLGMLEHVAEQLAGLSGQCPPPLPEPAALAVFAADHGVHAQGVTPWPQEVTAQMVSNFLAGGAVVNAFAKQVGAEVCVVDVGVNANLGNASGLVPRKVRFGTADMTQGPAMSRDEVLAAIDAGIETARDLVAAGNRCLLTGDMGIANTTASAALIAAFTGASPAQVTGYGTGIDEQTYAHKVEIVRRALELHRPDPQDPIGVLSAFGGLEHAALAGFILGGAALRVPVLLDGVIAGAAALVAQAIAPEVTVACVAGHRSAEPGHALALEALGVNPLIDLELRLGEGSGAVLALPLVAAAVRALREVATFDSAGVADASAAAVAPTMNR